MLSHFLFFSTLCFVVLESKLSRTLVVLIVFGTSLSAHVSNDYITQNTWKFIGNPSIGELAKNVNHITSNVGKHRWDNTILLDIEYGYSLDLIFNLNKHLGFNFNLNSNYLLARCSMWILTKKQDRVDVLFYNLILKSGDNFLFKRIVNQSESCEPVVIPQKRRPESLKFS